MHWLRFFVFDLVEADHELIIQPIDFKELYQCCFLRIAALVAANSRCWKASNGGVMFCKSLFLFVFSRNHSSVVGAKLSHRY